MKGASGKKEQPPGAMMALTFLAYLRGRERKREGGRERERERDIPGQYFSGGFPREKRGLLRHPSFLCSPTIGGGRRRDASTRVETTDRYLIVRNNFTEPSDYAYVYIR